VDYPALVPGACHWLCQQAFRTSDFHEGGCRKEITSVHNAASTAKSCQITTFCVLALFSGRGELSVTDVNFLTRTCVIYYGRIAPDREPGRRQEFEKEA